MLPKHAEMAAGEHSIVVLVNGNSASASEIVAAALQDAGRALVVGSSSYGKGTVQTVLRLPNEGELTLTWARFHAPSGYSLDRRGIMPDVCTSTSDAEDEDLLLQVREGQNRLYRELRQQPLDVSNEEASSAAPDVDLGAIDDLEGTLRLLREVGLL